MNKETSNGWCCELCGGLIKGECYNSDGYVTHIEDCSTYEVEE